MAQGVPRKADVADIRYPEGYEVIANNLDFGRGREHGEPNHAQKQIEIPQLEGNEAAVCRRRQGLLKRGLFGDEPVWRANSADEASHPLNTQLDPDRRWGHARARDSQRDWLQNGEYDPGDSWK